MNKKNKSLLIILLVLCIGLVGLTIAYFSNSTSIENEFNTNPYGTTVTEEFVSPDNWLPGTTTPKTLTVTNSGLVDEAVRISYEESWTSANSTEDGDLALTQNNNRAAIINWVNTDDWTMVTEDGKTYKYYNYKLSPSSTTSELLESVTFNSAITNSSNCTTTESNELKIVTCNSKGDGYDGATYKLTFKIETVQYDKYKEAWGTSINIASLKPMNASQLALKSNPVSVTNYTDGNIHEMYTFNHEATEQTPALTDYRYIGNDPYNYVYFNCDSLDNQNSETCEVWRIIGVFDVERPDPNDDTRTITERRMKLVRGSAFPERMIWDDRQGESSNSGINEWNMSSINLFLNGDYLDVNGNELNFGLKQNTQDLIQDTKYYLGGVYYYTTEEIYAAERGKNVFNPEEQSGWPCFSAISDTGVCAKREINWVGKIGLMYESDYSYTFSKGIDNICFNSPRNCLNEKIYDYNTDTFTERENPGYPSTSWIYNSNNLQNQDNLATIWALNPYYNNNETHNVIGISSNGSIYGPDLNNSNAVRPVLYLSSSVKIIDGTGQQNDPYKLSL